MLDFLLLCLATASISAAVPLNPPLQAVLQSPINTTPAPSPLTAYDTLFQQIRESESPRTFVGVLFESSSSLDMPTQYFEFPLGERISPRSYLTSIILASSINAYYCIVEFPMLPLHPAHARIVNATMRKGSRKKLLSAERLLNVMCLTYPRVGGGGEDDEHATGLPLSTAEARPIWWLVKDGEVDFEDPLGRWSLAGREVESYECI